MKKTYSSGQDWARQRIRPDQIEKYLAGNDCFIPPGKIEELLRDRGEPEPSRVREILAKALEIQTLEPAEAADLILLRDPELREEAGRTAGLIKHKVYDNRIVTFAPFYTGTACVNNCLYCGFRRDNPDLERDILSLERIRRETEVLVGEIGHKRLILVYGEHPASGIDYMIDSLQAVYSVRIPTRSGGGFNGIRRANINAPVLPIEELQLLHEAGIGTYQVFQETYHRPTYEKYHPRGTVKGDYLWRLYCMHRAFEAGIDDVGIGVLFGLGDWRYEVLGLLLHARELEGRFGIGPHTISFPRLRPALGVDLGRPPVPDEEFLHLITVLRLAVPYTGMIITAREPAEIRRASIGLGITQTDASSRIGVGAYAGGDGGQEDTRQQFLLGDTRSLDEVVAELARMGCITSFCTAGYRCGRTGKKIMDLLRCGQEGVFCKLNAIITFREWLDDFASPGTRRIGEELIRREIAEVETRFPELAPSLLDYYRRTAQGERDLYF